MSSTLTIGSILTMPCVLASCEKRSGLALGLAFHRRKSTRPIHLFSGDREFLLLRNGSTQTFLRKMCVRYNRNIPIKSATYSLLWLGDYVDSIEMDHWSDAMKILRSNDLARTLGVSRVTIWLWSRKRDFPAKVFLGENSVGRIESEIESWVRSRQRQVSLGDE